MKIKLFILSFVIFGLTTKMSAQPYFNYINYSSVWEMQSGGSDMANNYVSHFQYYINGDTTIGSYSYFKLYRTGVDSIIPINSGTPSATSVNYYVGALREDNTKKFYFIYQGQSTEEILFDFNLGIGSYLQNNQASGGCNNPPLMVQSYDTVYLGAIPLKRFKMNNITVQSIIEGVGSGGGLIEPGSMCLHYESYSILICYKTDYARLIVNSNYPCTLPDIGSNCQAAYTYTSNGNLYSFTNSSSADDSITSVYWTFDDGTESTIYNPYHTYSFPLNYTVCLYIQTSNGCHSSTCDTIMVSPSGVNEYFNNNSFTISPNPFSTETILQTDKILKGVTLTVYNLYGQQVKQITPITIGAGQTITLQRDNLPSGLYFICLTQENKTFSADKLVITDN